MTHTALRKHLKLQSSISSMQVLSTYFVSAFGQGVNLYNIFLMFFVLS